MPYTASGSNRYKQPTNQPTNQPTRRHIQEDSTLKRKLSLHVMYISGYSLSYRLPFARQNGDIV
jgi:hypothetical protein